MLQKHWQLSLIVVVFICVHFVCPLLCAAVGDKFCSFSPEYAQIRDTDEAFTCCHSPQTDATEVPSNDFEVCCYNDLTFVFSNDSRTDDSFDKLERAQFVSILLSTTIQSANKDMSLDPTYPSTPSISFFCRAISLRGPPFTLS